MMMIRAIRFASSEVPKNQPQEPSAPQNVQAAQPTDPTLYTVTVQIPVRPDAETAVRNFNFLQARLKEAISDYQEAEWRYNATPYDPYNSTKEDAGRELIGASNRMHAFSNSVAATGVKISYQA
jgi:hypothetical protein